MLAFSRISSNLSRHEQMKHAFYYKYSKCKPCIRLNSQSDVGAGSWESDECQNNAETKNFFACIISQNFSGRGSVDLRATSIFVFMNTCNIGNSNNE